MKLVKVFLTIFQRILKISDLKYTTEKTGV